MKLPFLILALGAFLTFTSCKKDDDKPEVQYQQAKSIDAAASSRRLELRRTEIAIRQASPLRSAQQQISERLRQAEMDREQTNEALAESNTRLIEARSIHDDARAKFDANKEAATAARVQLTAARDLDSKLIPVEERVGHTKVAAAEAEGAHEAANGRLNSMQEKLANIKEEIGSLEQGSVQLQVYEPFVHDSALWLERISRAIINERESAVLQQKRQDLIENLDEVRATTKLSRQVMQKRRTACTEA